MKGKSHQRWKKILVIHTEVLDNHKNNNKQVHNRKQFHRGRKALQKLPKQRKVFQCSRELRGVAFEMVEHQRNRCRFPYVGNAIFQPSKIKLV